MIAELARFRPSETEAPEAVVRKSVETDAKQSEKEFDPGLAAIHMMVDASSFAKATR